MNDSDAKTRLLAAAEELFNLHGFAAVKLRDIAQAAGLHHATFYHHVPGGKVELYRAAMTRNLERHSQALERIVNNGQNLRSQLKAICDWVLSHGAGNHARMLSTDLPNLPAELAHDLMVQASQSVFGPLERAFKQARAHDEITLNDEMIRVVAGALLAALQGQQAAHGAFPGPFSAQRQAHALVDVLFDGLQTRPPAEPPKQRRSRNAS